MEEIDACSECGFMKLNTLEKLYLCLAAVGALSYAFSRESYLSESHLGEIDETIAQEQGSNAKLHFLPIRGNFTRNAWLYE